MYVHFNILSHLEAYLAAAKRFVIFIGLSFMSPIGPTHISTIVHEFDISGSAISCQSVEMKRISSSYGSGKDAWCDVQPMSMVYWDDFF